MWILLASLGSFKGHLLNKANLKAQISCYETTNVSQVIITQLFSQFFNNPVVATLVLDNCFKHYEDRRKNPTEQTKEEIKKTSELNKSTLLNLSPIWREEQAKWTFFLTSLVFKAADT